jgi:hypothetical protein
MLLGEMADPAGGDVRGFGYGEHLIVWSWRRIAAGRMTCPVVTREFADACGEDGAEVFVTFCTFLKALGYACRRPLAIGLPSSLAVTADERRVLTLVAAAQAAAPALFEAHLCWLARPDQSQVLRIATGALAAALHVHDLQLSLPDLQTPDICARRLSIG